MIYTSFQMLTDDEELDPLVFDNLEVNRRAEVAHVDPASSPLYRILRPRRSTGLGWWKRASLFILWAPF